MTRLKAVYRSWAIPCAGKQVYAPRYRSEWLAKITEPGVRRRAEFYYQQLDALRSLRREDLREPLGENKKKQTWERLCQNSSIGPNPATVFVGLPPNPPPVSHQPPPVEFRG